MSARLKNLLGIGVSVALVAWMAAGLDREELSRSLGTMNYAALLPGVAVFVIHFAVRALRWRYLLPGGETLPVRPLFDALMVGNLATYLLPLRAGEFVRPFMYARTSRYSFPAVFVTVILERFFDLSAVLLTFGVVTTLVPALPDWVYAGAYLLCTLAAGIAAFILGCVFGGGVVLRVAGRLADAAASAAPGAARAALGFVEDFVAGASVLRRPRRLAAVLLLTALVWGTCFLLFYSFLFASPVLPRSFLLGTSITVVVALAVAAPSAPGFIGIYQAGCIAAFALFDVPPETATAYAIVTHAVHYVVFVMFGAWALVRNGLRLGDLTKRSDPGRAPQAPG